MLQLVPYDPSWPAAYEAERARLAATFGALALRIDHHGSTAVRGLPATPVIDIQVSVPQLHPFDGYAQLLAGLGYRHVPHPDDAVVPSFHRPDAGPHTHHVRLVQAGTIEEVRTLAFRDYLRRHPDVARDYAGLKHQLVTPPATDGPPSPEAYVEGKAPFVMRITMRALALGYPRRTQ